MTQETELETLHTLGYWTLYEPTRRLYAFTVRAYEILTDLQARKVIDANLTIVDVTDVVANRPDLAMWKGREQWVTTKEITGDWNVPMSIQEYHKLVRRISDIGKETVEDIGREHVGCDSGACPVDFKDRPLT